MTNVPATPEVAQPPGLALPDLPVCGGPATVRIEIYTARDGIAHGSLDGTVSTCEQHADTVRDAIAGARGLTPYRCAGGAEGTRCGAGMDYTSGRFVPLSAPVAVPQAATVSTAPTAAKPAEVVLAAAAGQPAGLRIFRTNLLRELARLSYAVDQPALPAPQAVRFDPRGRDVLLDFDSPAEAEAWAERLGGLRSARHFAVVGATGYHAVIDWRGVRVDLVSATPAGTEQSAAVSA